MFETIRDLWQFLRERKKLWLAPVIVMLILAGVFAILLESSAIAPFIYSLF